jgi:phenylpyruvate tautomerase PptA (4-oxalocrotonate tautomerase family)
MPILNVEIVTYQNEHIRPDLAMELANQAGETLGSAPGNTWVKVYLIAGDNYAENMIASDTVFPVFVSVLKAKPPSPESMQDEVTKLTAIIARVCNRPQENIHILYLPEGAGRIAFGGKVLPR